MTNLDLGLIWAWSQFGTGANLGLGQFGTGPIWSMGTAGPLLTAPLSYRGPWVLSGPTRPGPDFGWPDPARTKKIALLAEKLVKNGPK